MAEYQSALLIADIGSVTTRVVLVDLVNNMYRMVARTDVPSTVELPLADCTAGLLAGAREIELLTGRTLVQGDHVLTPHKHDGSGVDGIMVSTSAAGTLPLVVAAIAQDASGASARQASRSSYTTLLEQVTLDDQAHDLGVAETSWSERQVETLHGLAPGAVVLVGGVEGGAVSSLVRLGRLLRLTVLQPRPDQAVTPVLFAGNSQALELLGAAIGDVAPLTAVENVRPSIERETLAALRQAVMRLYSDQVMPHLPGLSKLRAWTAYAPRPTSDGYQVLVRFLAAHHQRRVLLVDVGAAATGCYLASPDNLVPAVLGDIGVAYGASRLLAQVGAESVSRWLPFELDPGAVTDRVLNQLLRPQLLPSSREDVLFNQALAREALHLCFETLREEVPAPAYDMVIGTGGALTQVAHPAQAALMLIDALQPGGHGQMATELYLDSLSLLPIAGAAVAHNPDVAYCLLEQDILRGGPLATVVALHGEAPANRPAVEVELTVVGGGSQTLSVMAGEIRRLSLPRGRRATLRLRPAPGVRIGRSDAGAVVQSDEGAISGSSLGVIIDARGRPLRFSEQPDLRRQQAWTWFAALSGAQENPWAIESGEPPAAMAAPQEVPAPAPPPAAPDPLPSWLADDQPAIPDLPGGVQDVEEQAPAPLDDDLNELRGALQPEEKKRRFFGR